jgi:hypothetical protein
MLNQEQLLELILEYLSGDSSRQQGFAGEALVFYVMVTYPELKTDKEIADKCSELMVNHTLASLHAKNLIDVNVDDDGEETYTVTDKGKDELELLH